MIYNIKVFYEDNSEYDYEQLPSIMQDDYMIQSLFKVLK